MGLSDSRIPTWRLDVEREIDVLEELARIYGYNNFPNTLPAFTGAVVALPDEAKDARVRETMLALGYDEAISITFISSQDAKTFGSAEPLALANPLSEEAGYMRNSLAPGLLNMVAYNLNRGTSDVRLFEAGEVFEKVGERHDEHRRLAFAATGNLTPHSVHDAAQPVDVLSHEGRRGAVAQRVPAQQALLRRQDARSTFIPAVRRAQCSTARPWRASDSCILRLRPRASCARTSSSPK